MISRCSNEGVTHMHAFVNLNDMNKLILIPHDKMMLKVITLLKHLISLLNYYDLILTLKINVI